MYNINYQSSIKYAFALIRVTHRLMWNGYVSQQKTQSRRGFRSDTATRVG
jgi:hypothetical protein